MPKPTNTSKTKLEELAYLVLCQTSVISHAVHMRDNDSMFERSKAHFESMIAAQQRKLDYLLETRRNADAIIDAAETRRANLQASIRSEKHSLKIEKFKKLQSQLKELERGLDL